MVVEQPYKQTRHLLIQWTARPFDTLCVRCSIEYGFMIQFADIHANAITVSAFLAGIKRSTGLTYAQPQPNTFSKNESVLLKSL